MKKILTVQGADGVQEKECGKCPEVMIKYDGGEVPFINAGDLDYRTQRDYWKCHSCGFVTDELTYRDLAVAFGLA